MKRILFVDDEANVLEGMRRMLRPMRREWQMEFADSGEAALKLLAENPCDMVISDMRMPVMDGAQLLAKIKTLYPNTVRIVLSGQSNLEKVLDSVGIAHQYLAKPCDAENIRSIINRAFAIQQLIDDDELKKLVAGMQCIPSLPELYAEITREIESPEGSIKKVGEIIERDMAMTAKILQLVNSAFFGLPRHVASPFEAATMLGMDVLRSLVLTSHVFSTFNQQQVTHLKLELVWDHCIRTGELAKRIASQQQLPQKFCDFALMAGMLHDIGKLVLAANLPQQYAEVLALIETQSLTAWDAERQVMGYNHAEIGAYLLGLWGLPGPVVEAVAYHHYPANCSGNDFNVLTATHVADNLCKQCAADDDVSPDTRFDHPYLQRLGIGNQITVWQQLTEQI